MSLGQGAANELIKDRNLMRVMMMVMASDGESIDKDSWAIRNSSARHLGASSSDKINPQTPVALSALV